MRALLNLILFILWPCPPWPRRYYERREWPSLVFDATVYKLEGREVGAQWWGGARGAWDDEPGAWNPCRTLNHRVTAPRTLASLGVSGKCC